MLPAMRAMSQTSRKRIVFIVTATAKR
jgi:hypothetical protein